MASLAARYPEQLLFLPTCAVSGRGDITHETLVRTPLTSTLVEYVRLFVQPEHIWNARLSCRTNACFKLDLSSLSSYLQTSRRNPDTEFSLSLFLGSPGTWACLDTPDKWTEPLLKDQHRTCMAHFAEEFALIAHVMAKHGSMLHTLQFGLDLRELSATCAAAAAYLFAVLAGGACARLKDLTVLHAGSRRELGGADQCMLFAPLVRKEASPLRNLRALRLSFQEARIPIAHLVCMTKMGGLGLLREFAFSGAAVSDDAALAELICALLGPHSQLEELDLLGSAVSSATLQQLADALENTLWARHLHTVHLEEIAWVKDKNETLPRNQQNLAAQVRKLLREGTSMNQ